MREAVRKRTQRDDTAGAGSPVRRRPRRALGWSLRLFALACLLAVASLPAAVAQTDLQAPEYRIKAAFLYKFGSYVEWPDAAFATPAAPLTIGVVAADALAAELQTLVTGRTIAGRPVAVRILQPGDPIDDVHVLFVGRNAEQDVAQALQGAAGSATLVVTESESGFGLGSAINFLVLDGKIRFDVALQPAEARSLKISSRLLAVARRVVAVGPS